jgi:hypothetical protein
MGEIKRSTLEVIVGLILGFTFAFLFFFNFAIWKHNITNKIEVDGLIYKCKVLGKSKE